MQTSPSNRPKFPFEIRKVDEKTQQKITKDFPSQSPLVEIGPEKWIMTDKFLRYADEIYNFEARADDVFISTFPRSGTTWTQEIIWLICNDLDYETASRVTQTKRFPFFE